MIKTQFIIYLIALSLLGLACNIPLPTDESQPSSESRPPLAQVDAGELDSNMQDSESNADSCTTQACQSSLCNPMEYPNQTCPEGEGCYLNAMQTSICAPEGKMRQGGFCQSDINCVGGLTCVESACQSLCRHAANDSDCEFEEACSSRPGWQIYGFCVQPTSCDALIDSSCPLGEGCFVTETGDTACQPDGSGTQGDFCTSNLNCQGGHACFESVCRPYCEPSSDDADCGVDEQCKLISNWGDYGLCVPARS